MKLDKDTKVCMLLRSLPPSFDGLVTALDSRSDDDISLDVVKSKLVDEYNRQLERKGGPAKVEKAMRSEMRYPENKPDVRTCHFCKKPGHIKRNCRKFLSTLKKDGNSSRSDTNGHAKAKAAQGDVRGVAFVAGEEKSSSWVIDSGASAHMTNDRSFFGSLSEFAGGCITLADGKKTKIEGEGSGVIHGIGAAGNTVKIEMNDVKFVPGLSTNLISVGKLAQKSFRIVFHKSGCEILDAEGVVVATGNCRGGLYYLRVAEASMTASEGVHKLNCQHQWHRRLDHRDWAAAERILKEDMATGIKNGVAERKNRSLTEMATCMLVDAGLEKRYWGEAILTATYLQNRLPSRSIPKTPYELWWSRKPDLSHLRVFGSHAYVHVPDVKRKKLDSKATKLTFIGYAVDQKGYRFVDLETDQITISRDARFIELGNGTTTVEVSFPVASKEAEEEEIQLLPKKEDIPDKDPDEDERESDPEDYYEADSGEEGASSTLRRTERSTRGVRPKYLDDFQLEYAAGVAACAVEEPVNLKDAMEEPVWRKAMQEELDAHQRNGTWRLVPLPEGRKVIGSKWVYKAKRDENNRIVKFKARLVAQGYAQRFGVDVGEVFAPVTSQATFRTFLTVAAKRNMFVKHLDIKTAYLHGILEEEVYMRQPPGFVSPGKEKLVCRLQRSIYGLRQSARCWNKRLHEVLVKNGFKAATADPCLYVKDGGKARVLLLVYVDDLLLASTDESEMTKIQDRLNAEFELTSLGEVRHFLGVEVKREGDTFKVSLRNYIEKLLKEHGMEEAKAAKSPMDPGYLKMVDSGKAFDDPTNYRSLVGGFLYLAVVARPDIAASAAILGRKFSEPTDCDWTAAKRVLRFLKGTKDYQLQLGGTGDQPLFGFSDADWAGDVGSRRSTSGAVFVFGGATISWKSRRQSCVTLSSMEAEYVALSEACQEALWLRQLLKDLGEQQDQPTVLKEDNQGCLAFVRSERTSRRSKHIDTRERFVQELCETKKIRLEYCPTENMTADIMTKPLGPQKHREFCVLLGLKEEITH